MSGIVITTKPKPTPHEAHEAYEAARAALARLYDFPDKTTNIHRYRGQLRRAQAAVLKAHAYWLAAEADE